MGGSGATVISNSVGGGAGGLAKDGSGTLTLSGVCSFSGATTLSAGTLALDYSASPAADTSKLSDSSALSLGGGTITLSGGTHTEEVASTTLTAGTATSISRSSGGAVIDLKAIAVGAGATLNLTTSGIAKTSNANSGTGILPPSITVASGLASRDSNGYIVGYTGYAGVNRLGGIISSSAASMASIVDGGSSGNITLSAADTTIHSLVNQSTGGAATVDIPAGSTLRMGADGNIMQSATATGALTFGAGGTLTAGGAVNTPGTITLSNPNTTAANRIIVNTAITDNGTGSVGLTKIGVGTADLGSATAITGTLATYGGSLNLTGTALNYSVGSLAGTGGIAGGGNALTTGADNTSTTYSGAIGGTGTALTKTGTGTLTVAGSNSYTGATVINAGTLYVNAGGSLTTATASTGNLGGTASITINNGGTLEFGGSANNMSAGANSIGTNSKPITVKTGGTLKLSAVNAMGYYNANQYANITLDGGTFNLNGANGVGYIGSLVMNTGSTANGAGAMQFWYAPASGSAITANDDAIISCGVRINDVNQAIKVVSGKTLQITGAVANWNGGTGGGTATNQGISKTGPGTLVLAGSNVFGGGTTVAEGVLQLGSSTALGATAMGTTIVSGAVLDLNGQSVVAEPITLNGAGISSGGAIINSSATGASVGTGAISVASASSIGGTGNFTLNGAISGTAALTKIGSGTVTLGGNSGGFSGTTTVEQGTLAVSGGIPNSNVTVADGATLGAVGNGFGVLLGNLTLGGTTGCTLVCSNLSVGGPASLGVLDLETNGVTTISASALGIFAVGSYPLISIPDILNRTGAGTFALAPLPRGVEGNLSDTGTEITLNITEVNSTIWKGTAGNSWDINTTLNWKLGASDPDVYKDGDSVVFDGSATNTSVTLDTIVTPLNVTFDFNSPKSYAISGTGAIAGATGISKKGTGLLTLSNANTFTGKTVIEAGTVQIGGAGTLGGGSYSAAIENSGTAFRYSSSANQSLGGVISGTGELIKDTSSASTLTLTNANTYDGATTVLAGTLQIGGAGTLGNGNYFGNVTVDGTLRYSSSTAQTIDGTITGTGGIVKDTAASALTLYGDNTYSGGTTIQAGKVKLGHVNAVGTGPVTLAATGNFLLDMNSLSGAVVFDNDIVLVNPANVGNQGITAPNGAGDTLELSGVISGGGPNSTLYLRNTLTGTTANTNVLYVITGTNTYSGKTYVWDGGVKIGNPSAFGTSAVQFDQSPNTPVTFASAMTVANAMSYTYGTIKVDTATFDVELSGAQTLSVPTAVDKIGTGKLTVSGACGGTGGVRVSEGTLRLAGINSYTGNTTVLATGGLELPDNARIAFKLAATTSNTLTGDGAVALDGDFAIDTSAVSALSSGTWVLENVSTVPGAYGSTFSVVNPDGSVWTDAGSDKWTKPGAVAGTVWTFNEATGTLTLGAAGYDSWKTQIPDVAQQGRDKDPDGDGFSNLQEFLFGTAPMSSNGTLVTTAVSGANLTLRWLQRETGASYALKESSTLAAGSWSTPVSPVPAQDGDQTGAPADYQFFTVTVPLGAGKDFFRIEGVEN